MSPNAEYEEIGRIFRPGLLSADEVATVNEDVCSAPSRTCSAEWPDESAKSTSYKIRCSGTGVVEGEVQRGGIVAPTGSNKATAPTTRSRDIVPDDSTAPALEPLADDCLLAGAAEV